MKKSPLLLAALCAFTPVLSPAARADVAWNHVGSIKIGKTPLVSFSMQNQWSGDKHRTLLSVDATSIANSFAPSNPNAVKGQVQFIQRLDDDRFIVSSPQTNNYFDEPFKSLKTRLRLNFWEALGSNLDPNTIPELTPAQRQRLGQELRAVITPFTKKLSRTYFRALPNARTINGIDSRGYRYTQAFNISPEKKGGEWIRIAAEWWLAQGLAGDEEIRAFAQNVNQISRDAGPTTASMWINEYYPVIWEAAPEEAHQALRSLMGSPDSPKYGFQGTPVQFYVTISGPPAMGMGMGGDIKLALELKNRNTNAVDATLFETPKAGERIELEPFLGTARNFIKMGRGQIEKLMK